MCHFPLGRVFRVVDEVLEENRGRRYDRSYEYRPRGVESSIEAELARVYASGEINRETFLRLRPQARQGQLAWADLDNLRREARLQPLSKPAPPDENAVALANIRGKKAALDQAARDSQSVAQSLENRIAGLAEEADRLEEQARETLPKDEEGARALLMKRQEMLEQSGSLKERVSALRQDIQRLGDLGAELDVREQELKVLQARERLALLEEEMKRDEPGSRKSEDA